ncbi:MAG TPA: hypothetical protein VHE32_04055 [Rhodanobacteraceae bacterium]|nr:hypothetical protein [Rhodanobacteraceae bacterium]
MRNEASLRRLAEMDIDVYVPRGNAPAPAGAPQGEGALPIRSRIALLARVDGASAKTLLAHICRAFAFAGFEGVPEPHVDATRLAGADGLVVFGKALAREAGAAVPTDRAAAIPWIFAADIAAVAGNGAAKRALWSECRRLIRAIARPSR